jgi:branched-chain amino acid aminotransferase
MKILRFRDFFEEADISDRVLEVVGANGFEEDIHFRLFVYPTEQAQRGRATTKSGIVIDAKPRPAERKKPAACQISSWRRGGDDNQPARVKAMGIRLFARVAMDQAVADGYDQLIFLNERGKVAEAVSSNIFLVRHGMVVTPEATASLLEGITRATNLTLLEAMGIPVVEREVDRTELYACDEAFLCSTGLEILPIASVDRLPVNAGREGEITAKIRQRYSAVVRGLVPDFPQWRTPVYRSRAT